jgi:hypothetical protein
MIRTRIIVVMMDQIQLIKVIIKKIRKMQINKCLMVTHMVLIKRVTVNVEKH